MLTAKQNPLCSHSLKLLKILLLSILLTAYLSFAEEYPEEIETASDAHVNTEEDYWDGFESVEDSGYYSSSDWPESDDSYDDFFSEGYLLEDDEKIVLKALIDWMKKNDASFGPNNNRKLMVVSTEPSWEDDLRQYQWGSRLYGLQSTRDISEGETLLTLPESLVVTPELLANESLPHQHASPEVILAAWLLREKSLGEASKWFPYLSSLPSGVDNPLFWDKDSLEELEAPEIILEVEEMRKAWNKEFSLCQSSSLGGADVASFHWAMALVLSQSVNLDLGANAKPTVALLPFVSFANHGVQRTVQPQVTSVDPLEVSLIALQDIPQDSPVMRKYNQGRTSDFLLQYGFVPAHNFNDSLLLVSDLQQLASIWERYLEGQLEAQDVSQETPTEASVALQEAAGEALRVFARVQVAREEKETEIKFTLGADGAVGPSLLLAGSAMCHFKESSKILSERDFLEVIDIIHSTDSRLAALLCQLDSMEIAESPNLRALACAVQGLAQYIRYKLQSYRSTYEEDLDKYVTSLEKVNGRREEVILGFRINQKKILLDFLDIFEQGCVKELADFLEEVEEGEEADIEDLEGEFEGEVEGDIEEDIEGDDGEEEDDEGGFEGEDLEEGIAMAKIMDEKDEL